MRLQPFTDLHINKFVGATVTELESGITNGMVDKRGETFYLTQRPSIDMFEDASDQGGGDRGRGLFYWDETAALYIINDGTLYKSSHSNSISTAPTAGTKKCYFFVLGAVLVVVDPENSQAFTISNADVVAEITDTDFPPKQTPAVALAYGGAVLDKYFFVMDVNGVIYNSTLSTPATWGALDFKEAEREEDGGVYLGKHHDNLVAYGTATIEFFYDAGNSTGSPLNRRQDIQYNIGCSNGESVWEEGDRSFFIGVNYSGALGVYTLEGFAPRKVSNSTLDSYLTQAIAKDGYLSVGSGFSAQGHIFYILTIYHISTNAVPDHTFVYDDTAGIWYYEWETVVNGHTKFPLVSWTKRRGEIQRYGEGILSNGDLITITDNLVPQDTLLASGWVEDGWVESGWVSSTPESSTGITMKSRFGMFDGGTDQFKYPKTYRQVSDKSASDMTLRWANENNSSFSTGKTLAAGYSKATRNGRFRRRNHEIEFSGTEQKRLEAIEVDI